MSEYKTKNTAEEEQIDLMRIIDDMWKGAKRYGIVLILLTIIMMLFFVLRTYRNYSPIYTSSATFIISADSSGTYTSSTYLNERAAEQIVKTFPYILESGLLQEKVAEDLEMETVPGSISTEILQNTSMITVTVKSQNPVYAQQILESVIEHYPEVAEPIVGEVEMNMLDITTIPTEASNPPNYRNSAVKGVIFGLAISFGFIFLYAVTRKTIHQEDDLKKILNIECICTIPRINLKKRSKEKRNDISIYSKNISKSFLETIRMLRTRIEKDARKNKHKVFLVTSTLAGEGKSTIAANIAMSLAVSGAKVVLVDCDLRNPSVRARLRIDEAGPGLYEFMTRKAKFDQVVQWNETYQMYVVPGGQPYNNASEILNSPSMKKLIELLREKVDYVILDTAPVGILTDTVVLADVADAALLVVKQDYANCSAILHGIEELAQSKIHIAGCILNDVELGIGGHGYKSHHYYNRYEHYGEEGNS